jgi:hypothetical protein
MGGPGVTAIVEQQPLTLPRVHHAYVPCHTPLEPTATRPGFPSCDVSTSSVQNVAAPAGPHPAGFCYAFMHLTGKDLGLQRGAIVAEGKRTDL